MRRGIGAPRLKVLHVEPQAHRGQSDAEEKSLELIV
jgi:hypothetical protein